MGKYFFSMWLASSFVKSLVSLYKVLNVKVDYRDYITEI